MKVKTKDNLTKNKLKEMTKYVGENEISETKKKLTKIDSNIKKKLLYRLVLSKKLGTEFLFSQRICQR
jgi:hypothetical protein